MFHRSTWAPHRYCYLEDLFVVDAARGKGLGRALIEAVYEKARVANASRVYWLTQSNNAQARALYDKVADISIHSISQGDLRIIVIPGWSKDQTRNLEIPGSMLRIAPE